MPSKTAVGAAPLITGIVLASGSADVIVQSGLSVWSGPAFVGGCAAIGIGLGILLGWDTFDRESTGTHRVSAPVLALTAVAFVVGAAIAIT